jgi:hypothetical protein
MYEHYSATGTPTEFKLKASNTGSFGGEEVTLVNPTGITWVSATWNEWEFANSTAYRYYRIYVEAVNFSGYGVIHEIEMMEFN